LLIFKFFNYMQFNAIIAGKILGELKAKAPFVDKITGVAAPVKRKMTIYQEGNEFPVVIEIPQDYVVSQYEDVELEVSISQWIMNGKSGISIKLLA